VKPNRLNVGPNHLSRIESGEEPSNLKEWFPDTQLFMVHVANYHFFDIIQFITTGMVPEGYITQQKKELLVRTTKFFYHCRTFVKNGGKTKYCRDMCHNLSMILFLLKLMEELRGAIIQERQPRRRFCTQDYGG